MKKIVALFMAAVLLIAMAGCSSDKNSGDNGSAGTAGTAGTAKAADGTEGKAAEAQDVTIKIWVPEEAVADTDKMVKEFDRIHDEFNITYEIAVVGIDEAPAQVSTDADIAADIFYVPSGGVADMANKGLLLPLVKDYETIEADLPESALTAVTIDGLHYAVPFSPNTYFMYYNKDLFTEEEVKNLDTMMAKDLGAGKWNFSTQMTNSWYAESFFFANGCTLFGTDGRDASSCTFNNAQGLAAGTYMIDLATNPRYLEDVDGVGGSAFKEGNLGAITTGAWSAPEFKEALGDKLGAVALPTINIDGSAKQLSNFVDFKTIAVKSNTAFPLCAQQLAVYFANADASLTRFTNQGDVPILKSLAESDAIKNDFVAAALNDQAALATNQPSIPQMGSYWDPMKAFGDGVYYGEINKTNLQSSLDSLVDNICSTLTN
ncbi:MAG: extracellular solute-binding protein [Lachnospiraceae bacterium]|nr:extracellular solute-binding protein [Lachnospiraceae bacterium]